MENKAGMKAATESFALSARFAVALRIKPRRELRNSVGMGAALQKPLRAPRALRLIKRNRKERKDKKALRCMRMQSAQGLVGTELSYAGY